MKFFFAMGLLMLLASCNEEAEHKPILSKIKKTDSAFVKPTPSNPYAPVDISPMDISYFPVDYPILKMSKKLNSPPLARVIYSRPHKQGRKIFGVLLKYGEPWRLGANEATEIEFFEPVKIQNKKVNKGKYILYSIPNEKSWTIVFNTNVYSWGLKQNASMDVHQFSIPVQQSAAAIEYFTMVFEKNKTGADLLIAWDDVTARLPIQFL